MWAIGAPRFDRKYLLNFFAVFDRVLLVSTMLGPMWITVRFTSRTSNSRPFFSFPRPNHRLLESTPSSYFFVSPCNARSHCLILPYRILFYHLPVTMRKHRRINWIRISKARRRYIRSLLDGTSKKGREDNLVLLSELLVETNEASLWLPKLPAINRISSLKLRSHSLLRLYCRLWRLRGIHHPCPIVQHTRIPNGLGFTLHGNNATLLSSISPCSPTTIVYVYCASNTHRQIWHGHTSFALNRDATSTWPTGHQSLCSPLSLWIFYE